jgi:flagellar FliL protein
MTITDSPPARIASSAGAPGARNGKSGKGGNAEAVPSTKKKKSAKLKIAVLVVLLLVGGAVAKFTVLAPAAPKGPVKPVPGPVVAMDELTLNLDGGHFLRLKLALQTTKGTSEELEVTEGVQAVIDEFSNRSVASLTGQKARDKVRSELLTKLETLYPKKIMGVLFTEFVMQ